jgi:hypothetical protein
MAYGYIRPEKWDMDAILNLLWTIQRLLSAALGVPTAVLVRLLSLFWPAHRVAAAGAGMGRGHDGRTRVDGTP